ncbi:MAG: transcription-repair coupling factor [Clostridia bacterium]|nr:transcription-repair coupling factor [Clostridia bacterium]
MNSILTLIRQDREYYPSVDCLMSQISKDAPLPVYITGLTDGSAYHYAASLIDDLTSRGITKQLILASTDTECATVCNMLIAQGIPAMHFKPRDYVFYNISASHDGERERLSVLSAILSEDTLTVVATPAAAASFTVPREVLGALIRTYRVGDEVSPETLADTFTALGYAKVGVVESAGQFARRGGIFDFFSSGDEYPVRVEFFGDEIDRIAAFDPITQRTVAPLDCFGTSPAVEVMLDTAATERVLGVIDRLISSAKNETMIASLMSEKQTLLSGGTLLSRDKYLGYIYQSRETLLDYMRGAAAVVIGTAEGEEGLRRKRDELSEQFGMLFSRGLVPSEANPLLMSGGEYSGSLDGYPTVHINPFAAGSGRQLAGLFGFRTKRTVGYGDNNYSLLFEDVLTYRKAGYKIIIAAPTRQGALSLKEQLEGDGVNITFTEGELDIGKIVAGDIYLTVAESFGFDLVGPKIALISTERDSGAAIMSERRARRILRRTGGSSARLMSHNDLSVGDYVVHANYGIGLFEGIQSVRVEGVLRDYITIRYAGTDKLFVPCDRLEMISKYIGARERDGSVKLSKMGGADWHRAKSRAKAAAQDVAKKLLTLYAQRTSTEGFAFPDACELEDEFDAAFEYELTDSQAEAIRDIKRDMMKPTPMNRLLLGDVGFGKTEVALRAAFKAILGGKQVAMLVPTTILALQHYQTALARMRGYPVKVEMLSRFRSGREQTRILNDLARGKIDLLIGTHKLLSKKIEFKRLGLLIVDEEQRFGVIQKERLKEMSVGVDVLTLSATPIPRTLNMAMNGIADMSILDEAPSDRRPVQTYVMEHDDAVIFDAIRRELYRGGQVLYLYNNIDTIIFAMDRIVREIPEARVAIAHGQMSHEEIEDIWQMLVRCEIDVLVCTTIIETGVDLPNANTLIIENADRMGLSQLHQIRGRVGRSERQAYAYFTYRPGKALTEVATKRLAAIREYAEFGAGFKVAVRDLEIRGAGNLLGKEQHGNIDGVGYDLYVRLLAEAVAEVKGTPKEVRTESQVDIRAEAYIPEKYIASQAHRMEMYKRISDIAVPADKLDVRDELIDRFGEPPRCVETLLSVALCRALLEDAKIDRARLASGYIRFCCAKADLDVWSELFLKYGSRLRGVSGDAPIVYRLSGGEDPIEALENIMCDYYKAKHGC